MSMGFQPGATSPGSIWPLEMSRIGKLASLSVAMRRVPDQLFAALYALAMVTRTGCYAFLTSAAAQRRVACQSALPEHPGAMFHCRMLAASYESLFPAVVAVHRDTGMLAADSRSGICAIAVVR